MNDSIQEAFEEFVGAVRRARDGRKDPHRKKELLRCLSNLFDISGKTKMDFVRHPSAPNKATIDRWFAGTTVPSDIQVKILREFLMVPIPARSTYSLSVALLSKQFRPVILFLLEEEKAGRELTENELDGLIWMAERSKGEVTIEMMRIFLGRQ